MLFNSYLNYIIFTLTIMARMFINNVIKVRKQLGVHFSMPESPFKQSRARRGGGSK
jgi:hypothetical protein